MRPDCPTGHNPPEHPCDWPDCKCFDRDAVPGLQRCTGCGQEYYVAATVAALTAERDEAIRACDAQKQVRDRLLDDLVWIRKNRELQHELADALAALRDIERYLPNQGEAPKVAFIEAIRGRLRAVRTIQ